MVIFIAGCFDILHIGHINLLLYARQLAGTKGYVYVSLDTDEKIKRDKGSHRPVFSQKERTQNLYTLQYDFVDCQRVVDTVFLHNDNTELLLTIRDRNPNIILVGDEYRYKDVVGSGQCQVLYYRKVEGISTSTIIKRINESYSKADREGAKP